MLEPYDGKLSRTVLRREGGGNTADPADYSPLVNRLKGQVIKISPNSTQFINPMDINANYSEEDNPLSLKADFILSLCELVVGGKEGLLPVEKTVIDRCVHLIYRKYFADPCPENMPILEDLYNALLQQDEKEAHHVATALEIYVKGSLNLFNHRTNVNVNNRIVCYDIKELGKQMKKLGMLIVQDQVWGRVTANRSSGKSTRYYMDEMHLLLKEEQTAAYSVEIWKRFRKWGGIPTGLTQNVKDLLSSREVENIFENSDMVATIQRITRKEKSENPPPLYDLTTLQRDANRLMGYSAQQTLDYVQSLYEKKLTTYPRTDSCYITDDDEEITSRYAKEAAERKNHLQALQAERDKAEKDLLALKAEILAVIKGESAFPKDTLAEMIAAQEKKHTELEALCEEASAELERNAELMANVSQLYEELISYADLYDSASFEAKKMIVSQLIRRIDVYRGYQIHVDFNFDLAQYLENSDELAC